MHLKTFLSVIVRFKERARERNLFENLAKVFFVNDPQYVQRFDKVQTYAELRRNKASADKMRASIELPSARRWRVLRHPVQILS